MNAIATIGIIIAALFAIFLVLKIVGIIFNLLPTLLLLGGLALIGYAGFRAYTYAKTNGLI